MMNNEEKQWVIDNFTEGATFYPCDVYKPGLEHLITIPPNPLISFENDNYWFICRGNNIDEEFNNERGWIATIKNNEKLSKIITPGVQSELNKIRTWLYND